MLAFLGEELSIRTGVVIGRFGRCSIGNVIELISGVGDAGIGQKTVSPSIDYRYQKVSV